MQNIFPSAEQAERPVPMEMIQMHLYEWAILQTAEKSLTSSQLRADSGTKQTKFLNLSNSREEIKSHRAVAGGHNGVSISTDADFQQPQSEQWDAAGKSNTSRRCLENFFTNSFSYGQYQVLDCW